MFVRDQPFFLMILYLGSGNIVVILDCVTSFWILDKIHNKGNGKGAGFMSWSQAGSHDFTILSSERLYH